MALEHGRLHFQQIATAHILHALARQIILASTKHKELEGEEKRVFLARSGS